MCRNALLYYPGLHIFHLMSVGWAVGDNSFKHHHMKLISTHSCKANRYENSCDHFRLLASAEIEKLVNWLLFLNFAERILICVIKFACCFFISTKKLNISFHQKKRRLKKLKTERSFHFKNWKTVKIWKLIMVVDYLSLRYFSRFFFCWK